MHDTPALPTVQERRLAHEPLALEGPCLVLVLQGVLHARDEQGDCVRVEAGDLLTVAPGARCALGGPRQEGELLLFHARGEWTRDALALAGDGMPETELPFHVDRCGSEPARRAARILRELGPGDGAGGTGLHAAARHLELLAIAFAPRRSVLEPGARRVGKRARDLRARFRELVAELAEAPLEGVALTSVAAALGASERQVSRLFRSELGTTFREHLAALRLERAKRLLRDTDLAVIEVAAEAGWSSLGHFTETFRRRVGQTPSRYRAAWEAARAA